MAQGLRALRRGLRRADGFALFIAVCNQPKESRQLIRALEESMPDLTLHTVELGEDIEDPLQAVLEQLSGKPRGPVMVLGLEHSNPSNAVTRPVLYSLNLGRAKWVEQLPQPVVFWIPEYLLGLMGREAPDFLDWRSDTVHFSGGGSDIGLSLLRLPWANPLTGLSGEERERRLAELESRLAALPDSKDPSRGAARAEWLSELGDHYLFTGKFEAALTSYEQAMRLEEELGRPGRVIYNLSQLATLQVQMGNSQAGQSLLGEALKVAERTGDLRWIDLMRQQMVLQRAIATGSLRPSMLNEDSDSEEAVAFQNALRATSQDYSSLEREKFAQKALATFERVGSRNNAALTLLVLCDLGIDRGDLAQAEDRAKEALEIGRQLGAQPLLVDALLRLADISMRQTKALDAVKHLKEARDTSRALGSAEKTRQVEQALHDARSLLIRGQKELPRV